jgi:hypothetical protein
MSSTEPEDAHDRLVEAAVRVASMRNRDPDEMEDLPPDEAFRRVMEQGRHPEEGDVAISVPAPHRPTPHDSAIALPLPVEHEPE